MAVITPMVTNFTGGMLSPRLEGRIDLAKYQNGAATLENFIVFPYGSITRRPGTEYIATAACSTNGIKLFPFTYSDEQSYVLEFGEDTEGYIRFFYDGELLDGTNATESVPNPYMTEGTSDWTLGGDWAYNATFNYLSKSPGASHATTQLTSIASGVTTTYAINLNLLSSTAGTFNLAIGNIASIWFSSATAGVHFATFSHKFTTTAPTLTLVGDATNQYDCDNISIRGYADPMKIVSPYSADELPELRIAQQADVVYFTHPNHRPYKLSRYGQHAWDMSTFTITSIPEDWSDSFGWPRSVAFYEQRLWYGGTDYFPQTIWSSTLAQYDNFSTAGTSSTRSGVYEIGSNDTIDTIQWLAPHARLIIGTSGSEWTAFGPNSLEAISPSNVAFNRESSYGTGGIKALLVGDTVIYIGKLGKTLRNFAWYTERGGYLSDDLSLLNDTILGDGINDFIHQRQPSNIIWAIRADGVLIGCTYYPTEEVLAWGEHTTNGTWETITVIPGLHGHEEVWLSTQRTANTALGTTTQFRFIERMASISTEEASLASSWYLDCANVLSTSLISVTAFATSHYTVATNDYPLVKVTTSATHDFMSLDYVTFADLSTATEFNGTEWKVKDATTATAFTIYSSYATSQVFTSGAVRERTSTVKGATWLRGQEVAALGDGSPMPREQVDNTGTVVFDQRMSVGLVGYPYTSTMRSLKIEPPGAKGTTQAHRKQWHEASIRFYHSVGGYCGISTSTNDLQVIPFRSTGMQMDTPIPLFTGDKLVRVPTGFNRDGRVCVQQDQPLPMTVLAIVLYFDIYDM